MQPETLWVDSNDKAASFDAICKLPDIDGTRHGRNLTPEELNALGYKEITVYERPDDYSDELYYRTGPQADAPYFIYTPKSPEQIAQVTDSKARDAAQRLLDSTDYLFSLDRHEELLTTEPEREAQLKADRATARAVIRAHKVKYPEVR